MYQNPPILTLVLNPFLEVWAILLLFVQQLIYSLRVILTVRKKLKIKISKPDKWTHKTAFRGFRWLQWVALLCSFHILGKKVGKRKIKYGKGHVPKVLLLLLVLYAPSLPTSQPSALDFPSGISVRQERTYAAAICMLTGSSAHADRLSKHMLWWVKQATCPPCRTFNGWVPAKAKHLP